MDTRLSCAPPPLHTTAEFTHQRCSFSHKLVECASRGALWEGGEAAWEVALVGAQASVTSFPPTLEPWQALQLFVVGDFGPVLATPVEPSREAK